MKMTKRCEYILEDGHKCNAVFSYNSRQGVRKYCHDQIGNDPRTVQDREEKNRGLRKEGR